jgi:hypothetical protein
MTGRLSLMSMTGRMVVFAKDHNKLTFYLTPKSRVLKVIGDSVSSYSSKNIRGLYNDIKNLYIDGALKMEFKGTTKIAKIDKVKIVKKHGNDVLKVWASSEEYDSNGNFAQRSLDLASISSKSFDSDIEFTTQSSSCLSDEACSAERLFIDMVVNSDESYEDKFNTLLNGMNKLLGGLIGCP